MSSIKLEKILHITTEKYFKISPVIQPTHVSDVSLNVIASCWLSLCLGLSWQKVKVQHPELKMKHVHNTEATAHIHQHNSHLYSQLWVYKWFVCVLHYGLYATRWICLSNDAFMTLPAVKRQFMLYVSASVCLTVWIYGIESCSCILLSDVCLLHIHRTVRGSRPHGNLLFSLCDQKLIYRHWQLSNFDLLYLKMLDCFDLISELIWLWWQLLKAAWFFSLSL